MTCAQYDVVVVGAGCAGLTAAIGLARAGFSVAVVEAAKATGGSGVIGGVCFAEGLIQPDILGSDGVESLAWERRLVERGSFATDGRRLAGCIYRDAEAFRSCYTVLRSHFTQNLAEAARALGAVLQTQTAVESLIRDGRRIIGVATTRGPMYARLVFLAEGDAGLLVSREGFDRFSDPRDQPAFLYCLQQVLELPPGAIEECFGVESDQGVAYDFLLRNPATMPLNARGLLCTNRQGLTLSIVLPLANLHHGFRGKPRQLLDWFMDMPALHPWLHEGQPGAWTAGLLRTGGLRDVPYLIEDGLVVGGAAAGLGIDFPVLDSMGPAIATGVLLSRAAMRIRAEGRSFDRVSLVHHYLGPLQQTRSWRDMEYVQRWPGYLQRAHVLFGHGLDLLLDSASVWARTRRWVPWKLFVWLGILSRVSWRQWNELRDELIQMGRVLRLREVTSRPALTRLLLDGALNAFRDLVRQPRPHLPPRGTLRLHFRAADEEGRASAVPWLFRRWFERFRPVLAAVARIFHANDDSPLSLKWTRTSELLSRQINLFDFLAVAGLVFPIAMASTMLAAWNYVSRLMRVPPAQDDLVGWVEHSENHHAATINPEDAASSTAPLIRIAWRSTQPEQQPASVRDLPHICPADVFELTGMPPETVQVSVHPERCIYCQACWRTNSLVDWGRNGAPSTPLGSNVGANAVSLSELKLHLDELERKLREFDESLAEGPALVNRPHNDYLEMLARYAQQLAIRIREIVNMDSTVAEDSRRPVLELADTLAGRTEKRTRRTWEGRFTWAAADGRLLCQHHLAELRRLLAVPSSADVVIEKKSALRIDWNAVVPLQRGEDACVKHLLAELAAYHYLLETLDSTGPEGGSDQDGLLATLVADLRDGCSVRTSELKYLLNDNPTPCNPNKASAVGELARQHERRLIDDLDRTLKLFDVPGDWSKIARLHVLGAEREELAEFERRLLALAAEWRPSLSSSDEGEKGGVADDEVIAGFGRQAAHILAGKRLLLRTFARLDRGDDAELAIVLLRVWLDHAAMLLDEYAIFVRERLHPAVRRDDRPLVEPGSGVPFRTQAEYLAAPAPYVSGDFLLAPLDLLQPRLVPEMVTEKEIAIAGPTAAALLRLLKDIKGRYGRHNSASDLLYLAEALAVETIGRYAIDPSAMLNLESACTRLVLADPQHSVGALRERCVILRALAEGVIPRWLRGGIETRARHLECDALELEAIKADFRRRLMAGWQVFGEALGRNADVQASCFALAEAAAWLKAADSTLGRMAWLSRLCQAEDREEPASGQELARRILAHSFAEIRTRLFRFDEDLASLRRGYYAPHVYAANLLLRRASLK
jgi:flavin-dependent dehydrogenase